MKGWKAERASEIGRFAVLVLVSGAVHGIFQQMPAPQRKLLVTLAHTHESARTHYIHTSATAHIS